MRIFPFLARSLQPSWLCLSARSMGGRPSSTFARNHSLDGLRGLAASAVIFYHAFLHNSEHLLVDVRLRPIQSFDTARDVLSKVALCIANGALAVTIFFVLSGFVLSLSLKRNANLPPGVLSAQFAITRLFRLYPAVIVCMAAYYLVSVIFQLVGVAGFPVFRIKDFIEHATLFAMPMHGPSLTVRIEVLAIPFLLVAFFVSRKLALAGAILCFLYGIYAIDGGLWVLNIPYMSGYLLPFLAGVLVADESVGSALKKAPAAVWWVVLGILLLGDTIQVPGMPSLIENVIASALLVGGLYHGQCGSLGRLLSTRPLRTLGRVSYSLYLLNVILLCVVWTFTDRWEWIKGREIETGLCVGLIVLLLSIPLSDMMERWVEQPGISLGRKVSERIPKHFTQAWRFTQRIIMQSAAMWSGPLKSPRLPQTSSAR
jgi:peptidoglycan/LPS O-acetylase OafA/YrhL